MDEGFVPFAELLRPAPCEAADALAASAPAAAPAPGGPRAEAALPPAVADLALLRLAALEAFERASARLLEELAREVLGRELALAPCDLDALVRRGLAAFAAEAPLCIVVSPADAGRFEAPLPVRSDPRLGPGDAIVEVRDGSFESFAAFRLRRVVERVLGEAP